MLDSWSASAVPALVIRGKGEPHYFFGQPDDLDQDGEADEAFFLIDMRGNERVTIQLDKEHPAKQIESRTQFVVAVKQPGGFDT